MRKANEFPGAFALVRISAAIGVDPSLQTSRMVAIRTVSPSPAIVGPKRMHYGRNKNLIDFMKRMLKSKNVIVFIIAGESIYQLM